MNKNTKWLKITFGILFVPLFSIGVFNYLVDPFWYFKHANILNERQKNIDERALKTNYIYANQIKEFDAVVLGSSRSTYIDRRAFNEKTFNLAFEATKHIEFDEYIEFAKKHKGKEFDVIYLGLTFFSTNLRGEPIKKYPKYYIDKVGNLLLKYSSLLSLDTLKYSVQNAKMSLGKSDEYDYKRNLFKHKQHFSKEALAHNKKSDIKYYTKRYSRYMYRDSYKDDFAKILAHNKNSKFIGYIMPTSKDHLKITAFQNCEYRPQYIRWTRELIDIFGGFYAFTHYEEFLEEKHFFDSNHSYPKYATLIAKQISQHLKGKNKKNIWITHKNIDEFLELTKKHVTKNCKKKEQKWQAG